MVKNILLIPLFFNILLCDWEIMSFPGAFVIGLEFNENNIFVIVDEGEVYHSTNEGETWSFISQIPNILPYGADLFMQIDDYLFFSQNIGGENSNYRSYYNGKEWEEWKEILYQTNTIIDIIHYNNEMYTLLNNEIVKSTDFGDSWESIGNPSEDGYLKLLLVDSDYIYVNHGCNLYRASTTTYYWDNITGVLNQIGPPEPYTCTAINDLEKYGNNLVISMYWYGGVGTLFFSENNGDNWSEITSFPAVFYSGYKYSVSDLLYKNGVLYAGTATSENGIYYTENILDWIEYSDGLGSFSLSVNQLFSTNHNLYKVGGTINIYHNQLVNVYQSGDVNQDGILNILDIVQMVNLVLNSEYNITADVNEDGSVDILDVVMMVNILVGGLP